MKLVREHINEKFTEDSDPIHDMGIGLSYIFPEILKSIFKYDKDQLFFTVQYIKDNKINNITKEIRIYLNVPRMNDFQKYCKENEIKKYVEEVINNVNSKYSNIFYDLYITGEFKYYDPDIDTNERFLKDTPHFYFNLNPEIKLKYNSKKFQRTHGHLNKIRDIS